MDPLTMLVLGAIGYAIFSESDESRKRREQAEAEYRAQVQREKDAQAQRHREWQEQRERQLQAARLEEARRNRKFTSTRECFAEQYVSFTRMQMYLTCPRRFKLVYLDRVKPKDDLLRFGKGRVVHDMIESYLTPMVGDYIDDLNWRSLLSHADYAALNEIPYMRWKSKQELIEHFHLRELATHFCRTFPRDVELVAVEHEFSFILGGVRVFGIADAIVRHDDGRCEIIDFKTGSRLPIREQLELYCLPLAQDPSCLPIRLRYMRLDKAYHHTWTVGRNDLTVIAQRMSAVVQRMVEDHTFNPICGDHCSRCSVGEECEYDDGDSDEYPVPIGHPSFARLRWRKPNVSDHEHAEDAKVKNPPKPRGRKPTGAGFEYVKGKQQYKCLETGQPIAPGEYHFADHNGKRLSVEGFIHRFPKRRDMVSHLVRGSGQTQKVPGVLYPSGPDECTAPVCPRPQPPASQSMTPATVTRLYGIRYVRAKESCGCVETGQTIQRGEFHFMDSSGRHFSVRGFFQHCPHLTKEGRVLMGCTV